MNKIYFQPSAHEIQHSSMTAYEVYKNIETACRTHPRVVSWTIIREGEISNMKVLDENTDGLTFHCPGCDSTRLECCEDGPYASEIVHIDKYGDFDYGEITANGTVVRFQCLSCGYILKDESGVALDDNLEVVEWIKEHPEGAMP